MRQIGYLAACGLYAIENNFERLCEDHEKALDIEIVLNKLSYVSKVEKVETNIIIFQLNSDLDSDLFLKKLNENGVSIISMGDNKLRIVTHLDYTSEMHEKFINILNHLKI